MDFPQCHALNRQNLYVMRITGEFGQLPSSFIKVGLSAQHADLKLQEVISSTKSFDKTIKDEVLAVKECGWQARATSASLVVYVQFKNWDISRIFHSRSVGLVIVANGRSISRLVYATRNHKRSK